jgi:electron transfer flavoprotein alpha subunit
MKEAEVIVAINHNAKESIFANADFGIVGDYTDVVTQLITEVKQGFVFGLKEESHV